MNLVRLPTEIHVHYILPYLPISDLEALMRTCKTMNRHCRVALTSSSSHPVVDNLQIPSFILITSYSSWKEHLLDHSEKRREWLRKLSKHKKHIPEEIQPDIRRLLICLISQFIRQDQPDQLLDSANLTSLFYRGFNIIFGLQYRSCRPFESTPANTPFENLFRSECSADDILDIQHIFSDPKNLLTTPAIIHSLIRALFWVQKEKYAKKRIVQMVERVFLLLPPLFENLHPVVIRRFIKIMGDEARVVRERLMAENADMAAFVPGEANLAAFVQAEEGAADDALNAARQETEIRRRMFEPIKVAVLVCISTATLYPRAFNAATLATIIRNAFHLLAWGYQPAELKYFITMLSMRIIYDVEECEKALKAQARKRKRQDPPNQYSQVEMLEKDAEDEGIGGKEKVQELVKIIDAWIPTIAWNFPRETLKDTRDLFRVHLARLH